jgi:hypothetical protein
MNLLFHIDEPRDMRIHLEIKNVKPNEAPLQGYWFDVPAKLQGIVAEVEINIPGRSEGDITRVQIEYLDEGVIHDYPVDNLPNIHVHNKDFWTQQLRNAAINAKPEE